MTLLVLLSDFQENGQSYIIIFKSSSVVLSTPKNQFVSQVGRNNCSGLLFYCNQQPNIYDHELVPSVGPVNLFIIISGEASSTLSTVFN